MKNILFIGVVNPNNRSLASQKTKEAKAKNGAQEFEIEFFNATKSYPGGDRYYYWGIDKKKTSSDIELIAKHVDDLMVYSDAEQDVMSILEATHGKGMLKRLEERSFNYKSQPFKTHSGKKSIDLQGTLACLEKMGVRVIKNECETTEYAFVADNIIAHHDVEDVKIKFIKFVEQFFPNDYDALLANGKRIDRSLLLHLPMINPALHTDTQNEAFFYYQNGFLEISKDSAELKNYFQLDSFIYADSMLKRQYVKMDSDGEFSKFISLICGNDTKRIRALKSALGYMLSRHKCLSNVKALILTDESLKKESGGTGKGILLQALGHIREVQNLDFRTRESNRFLFQGVRPESDILHIEDAGKDFDFGQLFNSLSGDLEVENKGRNRINIPFAESPKIAITTNFYVGGNSSSHNRRKAEYELYNHFSETYRPIDEFGHELFKEWDEVEWSKFDNFMVECVQLYLTAGIIEAERINSLQKSLILELGESFADFMMEWTKQHKDFSGTWVKNDDFFSAYRESTLDDATKSKKLKMNLKKWAELNRYDFEDKRIAVERGFVITVPKE